MAGPDGLWFWRVCEGKFEIEKQVNVYIRSDSTGHTQPLTELDQLREALPGSPPSVREELLKFPSVPRVTQRAATEMAAWAVVQTVLCPAAAS